MPETQPLLDARGLVKHYPIKGGVMLKEIAAVRDTREKTVRQQASAIYDKSGLEGRHALAAWFLEDFIAPDTG